MLRSILLLIVLTVLAAAADPSIYDFSLVALDGKEVRLKTYEGKVLLLINVASQSIYSDQIQKMETLYEKYQAQGLVVLAIPTNDFGSEEPGTGDQLKKIYVDSYHLRLPVFAKISVRGKNQVPLYSYLADEKANPKSAGEVPWNFTKILVDRAGKMTKRFDADTPPDSPELVAAIEEALAAKPKSEVPKGDKLATEHAGKHQQTPVSTDRHS